MFFPLMKVLDLEGFLELSYMPANEWENRVRSKLKVYLLWSDGNSWNVHLFSTIKFGEVIRISTREIDKKYLASGVCLFYPTTEEIVGPLLTLPTKEVWSSRIPEWRCTTGFYNTTAQTSYQGEIFPLPSKARMLTFHPFIQYGEVDNYLLVLNISKDPEIVESRIELFNSADLQKKGNAKVRTNSATCIALNDFNFLPIDLPLFVSPSMAGVPFGLGISHDGQMLSMEHTHPPASFVLFGNRNAIQGKIKKTWFKKVGLIK
jgi:hypothetical protein